MENFRKCPSCKKDVAANNFVIHSAHCERNITNCRICSEPILLSELEEHELSHKVPSSTTVICYLCGLEFSKEAYLEHKAGCKSCEMCLTCGEKFQCGEIKQHEKSCKMYLDSDKLLECQFCDLELPLHLFDDHVTACGARTEKCTICDQYVMYKDKGKHKNNCGKERMSSVTKSFICRYCRKELPYDNIHEHDRACGSKTKKCPKCDSFIKQKEFLKHISICAMTQSTISGQCDICGLTVKWMDMHVHKLICRYEIRPYDADEENNTGRNSESVTPPPKSENLHNYCCKFCGKRIPYFCLSEHEEKCQRQKQDFSSHNKKRYPKKNKDFYGSNSESLKTEKNKTSFSTSNRTLIPDEQFYTACPYCTRKIVEAGFDQHLQACSQNLKTCKFCNRDVPKEDIDAHLEKCLAELHVTQGESHERKSDVAHNKSNSNKANKPSFSLKKSIENFIPQRRKDKRQEKEETQQPISEPFPGEILIPCEFCDLSLPMHLIIEHQSGCRPDLLHFSSKESPDLPDNQLGASGQAEYLDNFVYEAQNQVNLKKCHKDFCRRNEKTSPSRKHLNSEYDSYDDFNPTAVDVRTETFGHDCSQQTWLRKHEMSASHTNPQRPGHKEQHSPSLEEKWKKVPLFKFGNKESSDEEVEEKNTNWDYEEVPRDIPLKHPQISLPSTNLGTKFISCEKRSVSSDSLEETYYSLSEDESESIVASNNCSAEDKDCDLNAYLNFLEKEDCLDTLQLSNNMKRNCKCNGNIGSCLTLNNCIPEVSSTGACGKLLSGGEKDRSSTHIMNNKRNSTSSDEGYTYEKFIEDRKKYGNFK